MSLKTRLAQLERRHAPGMARGVQLDDGPVTVAGEEPMTAEAFHKRYPAGLLIRCVCVNPERRPEKRINGRPYA